MGVSTAGTLSDGRAVEAVRFGRADGLQAEVLTFGATLRSLTVLTPTGRVEVLLQLPTLADYEADARYLNPVIGRCANRIGGAAFEIDGRAVRVTANEGANCLHGGAPGWHKRLWTLERADQTGCTLAYTSPDGESGFPGEVRAEVRFEIAEVDILEIAWSAVAGAPTPVNLTHHLYFNLSGQAAHSVLEDRLAIAADGVTPVGEGLIPTGEVRPVDASPFDLRTPRRLGEVLSQTDEQLTLGKGIDLNWVLKSGEPAATLMCPTTGLRLALSTDQPGLQVYTGQGLHRPFRPHQAVVLEPQGLPDAVNHPAFPTVLLRPGEAYRRWARYRLSSAS